MSKDIFKKPKKKSEKKNRSIKLSESGLSHRICKESNLKKKSRVKLKRYK